MHSCSRSESMDLGLQVCVLKGEQFIRSGVCPALAYGTKVPLQFRANCISPNGGICLPVERCYIELESHRKVCSMRNVEAFYSVMRFVKKAYTNEVVLHESSEDLRDILQRYPQIVIAMNHGPMAGPLAGSIAMMYQYYKSGGGQRKPIIIAWRGLYQIPFVKHVIRYMSQVRTPPNLEGFAKKLTQGGFTDLFVMPEGENCSFGNGLDIEPFLSPRFIELALRVNTPILIAVFVGSEIWSNIIPVSDQLTPLLKYLPKKTFERLQATHRVNVAPLRLQRIPKLQVSFRLYQPTLTANDLNAEDIRIRLQNEAEQVRAIMQEMVDLMAKSEGSLAFA